MSHLRHIPPVAMQVRRRDIRHGFAAIKQPQRSLETFASRVMQMTGSKHTMYVDSGRTALTVILLGLRKLSKRKHVIIPAYSCPTVVLAVTRAGLEPVFCDVDPHTLGLDRRMLHRLISDSAEAIAVLAVIPTHLYGLAQDITDVVNLAHVNDIFVIEDAAQSFGARINGSMVGTSGDAGFYSLGRGKSLPAGHGGIIVMRDAYADAITTVAKDTISSAQRWDIAALVKLLGYSVATHPSIWWWLIHSPLNPADAGMDTSHLPMIPMKGVSPVLAGVASSMIERLEETQTRQRRHAHQLIAELSSMADISIPEIPANAASVFLRLPVVLEREELADALFNKLSAGGIGVSKSYKRCLPDLFAVELGIDGTDFPGARHLARCLLTLPTNAYVTQNDIFKITAYIEKTLKQKKESNYASATT